MIEKTKIILVVCLFVTVGFSYSQNRISGKLTDESLEALAFANIVLYQSENTKAITGTVSDENGFYSFENIANGSYWLDVAFPKNRTDINSKVLILNLNCHYEKKQIYRESNYQCFARTTAREEGSRHRSRIIHRYQYFLLLA